MKFGLKGGILIFVDNDPQGYKLSCCGGFALDFFSFIQIAFGHAVRHIRLGHGFKKNCNKSKQFPRKFTWSF
jgi:hypothetical protein